MDVADLEKVAKNRVGWRHTVKEGCNTFEKQRLKHADLNRAVRKGNAINLPDEMNSWMCKACRRVLLSKAGYVNYQKKAHTHVQTQSKYKLVLPQKPDSTTCVDCKKV